jgi:hypothetical protein
MTTTAACERPRQPSRARKLLAIVAPTGRHRRRTTPQPTHEKREEDK